MPQVRINYGPFASEEEAKAEIQKIYACYHPAGYGTYCDPKLQPDGTWRVVGYRWDSCD